MNYIAYTTKGLETVCQRELEESVSAFITEIANKRILFSSSASFDTLVKLKTIDDIGIFLAKKDHCTEKEDVLEMIKEIDLFAYTKMLQSWRDLTNTFSLTASFAKTKSLKPEEILADIATYIEKTYSWHYTDRNHTNRDIRIFIDNKTAYVSLRLTPESLYHRAYRIHANYGSLRPSIAAAMVQLTCGKEKNRTILDTFCGSGTILTEAFLQGHTIYGSDIHPVHLSHTIENAKQLGFSDPSHFQLSDAMHTSWPSSFFDAVISNLPWGKQIKVSSITKIYEDSIGEFSRVLKPKGKLCLLVTKPDICIKYLKKFFPYHHLQTYRIGILGQTPTLIHVF